MSNLILLPHSVHDALHRDVNARHQTYNLPVGRSETVRIPMPSGLYDLHPEDRLSGMTAEERARQTAGKPRTDDDWLRAQIEINAYFAEAARRAKPAAAQQVTSQVATGSLSGRQEETVPLSPLQRGRLTHQILGGSDVIGANAHLFSYGSTKILVDCGMLLTGRDDKIPYDLVVPDITSHLGSLNAIVLTHVHQDHIGAIPYFVTMGHKLPPIYCDAVTGELLKGTLTTMLKQMHDPRASKVETLLDLRPLTPGTTLSFGAMTVEPISVAHSAAFTSALAIKAGGVTVLHSADLNGKISVPIGPGTNYKKLAALASEGVDALLLDSTRADVPGSGLDERRVGHELTRILHESKGKRVLVTCFSTSLHRIYHLMEAAARTNRAVVIEGRGLESMLSACKRAGVDLGRRIPNGGPAVFMGHDSATLELDPRDTLVIMTGCQAEPYAALTLAAQRQHPRINLGRQDVVVMSSSEIPNNADAIAVMKSGIKATGARLITSADRPVHASGHGHQDDLATVIRTVKPRFGIPIHGDPQKRAANENLMRGLGAKTLTAGNGAVISYGLDGAKIETQIPSKWLGVSIQTDSRGRTVAVSATPFSDQAKTPANDWNAFTQGVTPLRRRPGGPDLSSLGRPQAPRKP